MSKAILTAAERRMAQLATYDYTGGDASLTRLFGLELLTSPEHADFFARIELHDASLSTTQRRVHVRYDGRFIEEFDNGLSYPYAELRQRRTDPWARHSLGDLYGLLAPWLVRNKEVIETGSAVFSR